MSDLDIFLQHLFGDRPGYVSVCTNDFQGKRTKKFEEGKLWPYPITRSDIARKINEAASDGLDTYICAHSLRDRNRGRVKPNADRIWCLWADLDGAPIPTGPLAPTMIVETSPNRWQVFYALSRALEPIVAEAFSHRLTDAIGADAGGWMLTKLVRPAGSISYKHGTPFTVRIGHLDPDRKVDPNDLDQILPAVKSTPKPSSASPNANPDDEPPIVLSPSALAFWSGERRVLKKHEAGVIDRSGTLYKIGADLWEHGANRQLIISALAERDIYFGWNRYTEHPEEYARIAAKVAGNPRLVGLISTIGTAPPADPISDDACSVELAKKTAELKEARLTISGMVHTFLNPYMPQSEKIALISALNLAEQKRQRGEVRPDGSIELTAGDISQDFRPEPAAGESVAQTNQDGSKPRMKRQQVKPVITTLADRGFLKITPRSVTRVRANGARYNETVWDAELPDKPSDVLAMAATWKPDEPRMRKPRSRDLACPHCNEVHPIKRQDWCQGCGSLRAQIILEPTIEEPIDDELIAADAPIDEAESYVPKFSGHRETPRRVVVNLVPKNSGQGEEPWMPGFEPSRADRYTDASLGGRP